MLQSRCLDLMPCDDAMTEPILAVRSFSHALPQSERFSTNETQNEWFLPEVLVAVVARLNAEVPVSRIR